MGHIKIDHNILKAIHKIYSQIEIRGVYYANSSFHTITMDVTPALSQSLESTLTQYASKYNGTLQAFINDYDIAQKDRSQAQQASNTYQLCQHSSKKQESRDYLAKLIVQSTCKVQFMLHISVLKVTEMEQFNKIIHDIAHKITTPKESIKRITNIDEGHSPQTTLQYTQEIQDSKHVNDCNIT